MTSLAFPDPPLADAAIALRAWTGADAPAVAAFADDEEILRRTAVPEAYTADDARLFLAAAEEKRRAGSAIHFAVTAAGSGEVLGSIDLRFPDGREAPAEIGYLLLPAARGRGTMTRAVRLLSRWALEALGAPRVLIYVHPGNPRRWGFPSAPGSRG